MQETNTRVLQPPVDEEHTSEISQAGELDISRGKSEFREFIGLLRPHQWAKNILLFLPMLMAHVFMDLNILVRVVYAFIAFCAFASSIYVFNDILDVKADRAHPTKCKRPIASGSVSYGKAVVLGVVLLAIAISLSTILGMQFLAIGGTYYVLAMVYSFWGKRVPVLDLFILSSFYTIRVIAGGASAPVEVSEWLLAFSLFFFLSLACAKRFVELSRSRESHAEKVFGRGYGPSDETVVGLFGITSGCVSALVLALYINNPNILTLYPQPYWLWLTVPLVLYWVFRIWLLAFRGVLNDDPVLFAVRDRVSYVTGLLAAGIGMLAM